IESWITGDKREHHLLDRPRNNPNRTAIGAMALTFVLVTLINGGNDLLAVHFDLSINQIMWFSRIGVFVLPPIAFVVTKRICLSLQRADREMVLHGKESGRLVMLPHGEYIEVHEPLTPEKAYQLTSHEQLPALSAPETDERGVALPKGFRQRLRARWSKAASEQIAKPTVEELKEIEHH
ncbi:MAG: ubiquinol-cytochrome c reductase cytochrome b subunit, partial [Actinobacteria bacterium]|nr:ubiquinol-cytochrome c reductase cytochrome b subunit [Actinomycetota bacterium]